MTKTDALQHGFMLIFLFLLERVLIDVYKKDERMKFKKW
jgi:hypothetical protein